MRASLPCFSSCTSRVQLAQPGLDAVQEAVKRGVVGGAVAWLQAGQHSGLERRNCEWARPTQALCSCCSLPPVLG